MTLDEYTAGTDKAWTGYAGDHRNMLAEAIERLDRMTRERNRWKLAAQAAGVTGDDRFVHSGE